MPRVVDSELQAALNAAGAVVVEGPKACGKTETAKRVCASSLRLDVNRSARMAAEIDPSLALHGNRPRLIDEWQIVPDIWSYVRREVDDTGAKGQFVLTGSANPSDDATRHTGAGRFARILMRPMSLFEQGASSGQVSLAELLAGRPLPVADATEWSLQEVAENISSGGWPDLRQGAVPQRLKAMRDYVSTIQHTDVNRVGAAARQFDPDKVGRLLQALARHTATPATETRIVSDVSSAGERGFARGTFDNYVSALTRLMIIEDQPSWAPHLRSRARLRSSAKRHFVDPAIAVAALGGSPNDLLKDPHYLGLLFESLVIRDLRIYSQPGLGVVRHYMDSNGSEADAIVNNLSGEWAAFEVKLGQSRIDEGAASLLRFINNIDTAIVGAPSIMAVIVPHGYSYMRSDGIAVIPITALGP